MPRSYDKAYYDENKERINQQRRQNPNRKKISAKYWAKNRKRILTERKVRYAARPKIKRAYLANTEERRRYLKAYRAKNAKRLRQYDKERRRENPELFAQRQRDKRQRHGEKYAVKDRKRYPKNRVKRCRQARAWSKANRARINKRRAERLKSDLNYRLSIQLRVRLCVALKIGSKSGSAVRDLGCTIPEFVTRITSLFKPNMSWANWGRGSGKWHLDHIRPLASYDLTDREQFLEACHYTNLQPLWEHENHSKGAKFAPTTQPLTPPL